MHPTPDDLLVLTVLAWSQVAAWSLSRTRLLTQARVAIARIEADTTVRTQALAAERDRLLLFARDRLPGCTATSPVVRPVDGAA
ncbi:hypothetical protein [Actinomycetospora soli]|uniref:hypothetical protein n=1 Tax=Actinomycetospora soli TaxID=2893887 RepID=UPI001E40367D|nr:hypothetical protein [Actinomycetospora soli]MCD2191335.1 hypothetical protein [Actinomycetospora soli]